MNNLHKKMLHGFIVSFIIFNIIGCGETQKKTLETGTTQPVTVDYGMYGVNKSLGSPEMIRIVWNKKSDFNDTLRLSSDVNTSLDTYLLSKYGPEHYDYNIYKASAVGIYKITCSSRISSGEWIEYICLRDGEYLNEQDTSRDNGFVIKFTGSNKLYHSNLKNTGTESIGSISYHN